MTDRDLLKNYLTDDDGEQILTKLQAENSETLKEYQEEIPSWNPTQIIGLFQHIKTMYETQGAEEEFKKNILKYADLMIEKAKQASKTEEYAKFWENFEKNVLNDKYVVAHFQGKEIFEPKIKIEPCKSVLEYTLEEIQRLSVYETLELLEKKIPIYISKEFELTPKSIQEFENNPEFIKWNDEDKSAFIERGFDPNYFQSIFLQKDGPAVAESLINKLPPEEVLYLIGKTSHRAQHFAYIYKTVKKIKNFLKNQTIDVFGQPLLIELQKGNPDVVEDMKEQFPSWTKEQIIDHIKYVTEMYETPGAEEELKNNVLKYADLMIEKAKQAPRTEENRNFHLYFEQFVLKNKYVMAHFQEETAKMGIEETIATDLEKDS